MTDAGLRRLRSLVVIASGVGLLAALGVEARSGPLVFDQPLADVLRLLADAPWVRLLNLLVSVPLWPALIVLLAAFVLGRRHTQEGLLLLLALSAEVATAVVKLIVNRPRPLGGEVGDLVATASFPSGHVVRAVVALGLLIVVLGRIRPRWQVPAFAAATVFILALAIARVASGEHWPSDVLGGVVLGAVWLRLIVLGWPAWGPRN